MSVAIHTALQVGGSAVEPTKLRNTHAPKLQRPLRTSANKGLQRGLPLRSYALRKKTKEREREEVHSTGEPRARCATGKVNECRTVQQLRGFPRSACTCRLPCLWCQHLSPPSMHSIQALWLTRIPSCNCKPRLQPLLNSQEHFPVSSAGPA